MIKEVEFAALLPGDDFKVPGDITKYRKLCNTTKKLKGYCYDISNYKVYLINNTERVLKSESCNR